LNGLGEGRVEDAQARVQFGIADRQRRSDAKDAAHARQLHDVQVQTGFNPDTNPPTRHNVSHPGITLLTSQVVMFRGEGDSVFYRVVMKRDDR
jgi:hypothetical protein